MLIVQEFNSLHNIDPEFVSALELLMKEEVPNFHFIKAAQDSSPATDFFTYYLFFGPTQNTPIGFAQVRLRSIPSENYLSLCQKLAFWNKEHKHWKEAVWNVFGGNSGVCLFDPKFARSGAEKIQELIWDLEARLDIMAHDIHILKGIQNFKLQHTSPIHLRSRFVLESLPKAVKTYQDYLSQLPAEMKKEIKAEWKRLNTEVAIGDYALPDEELKLSRSSDELALWASWGASVLTFEKEGEVLGFILMIPGKDGNYFFEPFPLEPENRATVNDQMYIQYALLKYHDIPEARRCHIFKDGGKLTATDKKELEFFTQQGFQTKEISEVFYSKIDGLVAPL